MLDHPTHHQLKELKLDGMADAFAEMQSRDDAADLSHAEWLGLLIDREASNRSTKKFQSRMLAANVHAGPPSSHSLKKWAWFSQVRLPGRIISI